LSKESPIRQGSARPGCRAGGDEPTHAGRSTRLKPTYSIEEATMPTEEQHSWLQNALGVVGSLTQSAEDTAGSALQPIKDAAADAVRTVESDPSVLLASAGSASPASTDAPSEDTT